jgi:cysteine desulfurase family protein
MLLQGLTEKGDHVVTTMLEHNSVLRPLHHMQLEGKIEVTHVPFDQHGYVHPDDIKDAFKKNTKLVIVNHSSNVIGTIQPLKEIGKICKENGVFFVVDSSQSAGAIPIDMKEMGIDALAFTGHKCLMGPTGIGGSYVMEGVPVKGTRFGGTGVRSAVKTHLEAFPYRLECGTMNLVGVAGLYAGVKWVLAQGMEELHNQEMTLWDRLRKGVQDIPGVVTYCAENTKNQNPVLCLNVNGFEAADVGTILDVDYEIACRTGLHCAPKVHELLGTVDIHGAVRLSIGPFNTIEHVDLAIEAVKDIASIKNNTTVFQNFRETANPV